MFDGQVAVGGNILWQSKLTMTDAVITDIFGQHGLALAASFVPGRANHSPVCSDSRDGVAWTPQHEDRTHWLPK